MKATKAISAVFNGRDYKFKRGQEVEAPKALENALKDMGLLKESRAKENKND